MSEWWESAPLAPADDPAFTGYIPGTPKPKEPKAPVFVPKDATQMFDPNTGTYKPVPQPAAEGKDALKSAIEGLSLDELLTSVTRARKNVRSGWATGGWGKLAEMKPGGGTPRDDFLGNLKSIQGGIINEKLAALKQASATGASGLGALSEKEGERLASSVTALTENMSDEAYEESFKEIARHAYTLQAVRDGKDPRSADTQKAIESQVSAFLADQAVSGGGDTPPPAGTGDLTDEQKQAYGAFIASHGGTPSEGDVQAFLEKLLNKKVTNAAAIAAALNQGRGVNTSVEDLTYKERLRSRLTQEDALGLGDGAVSTITKQGSTLGLSDEAAGVGNAAANIVTSSFTGALDPIGAYQFGRDAERMRIDDARQQLGYGATALEFGGGLVSANPEAALAPFLGRGALIRQGARAGAAGGVLAGYGYGEGLNDSATNAVVGAGTGAVLGAGLSALSARYAPRGMAPALAAASDAEGVDLIRPMVDPRSRSKFGALESDPAAQATIRAGSERVRGQIEGRVENLGAGGTALATEAAGGRVQAAANRFITRSRGVANTLYNRARTLAGNATVTPREALTQMRQELMSLRETPNVNQGEIAFINELGGDLTNGPLSVDAIRGLRAGIRGRINASGLTASQADARATRVLDALQRDATASLPPAAATAYRRADSYYRERMVHIDDVISRFLGPNDNRVSGEQAFTRLKAMASPGGDGRRLAAIMRNLDGNERQDIAASIAHSLGRDAEDAPFSAARFISQTSKFSPSARRTIFGPDGAESINNLRLLSRALVEAGGDINRSRSTTVANRLSPIKTAARSFVMGLTGLGGYGLASTGGAIAGATAAAGTMAGGAGLKVLSARAMVNPRVTRWLAQTANTNTPSQAQQAVRRLGAIISREPALAGELQPVRDFLTRRLSAPPLSAEPESDGGSNEQ